jgi:hypothetical protein
MVQILQKAPNKVWYSQKRTSKANDQHAPSEAIAASSGVWGDGDGRQWAGREAAGRWVEQNGGMRGLGVKRIRDFCLYRCQDGPPCAPISQGRRGVAKQSSGSIPMLAPIWERRWEPVFWVGPPKGHLIRNTKHTWTRSFMTNQKGQYECWWNLNTTNIHLPIISYFVLPIQAHVFLPP